MIIIKRKVLNFTLCSIICLDILFLALPASAGPYPGPTSKYCDFVGAEVAAYAISFPPYTNSKPGAKYLNTMVFGTRNPDTTDGVRARVHIYCHRDYYNDPVDRYIFSTKSVAKTEVKFSYFFDEDGTRDIPNCNVVKAVVSVTFWGDAAGGNKNSGGKNYQFPAFYRIRD